MELTQNGFFMIRKATIEDREVPASIINESFRDVANRFSLARDNCPKHPSNCETSWIESDTARGIQYFVLSNEENSVGVWKGWAKTEDADACEKLLRKVVFPELKTIKGYIGGYIFRHDSQEESEFVTMNLFESIEAVKKFAGPEYDVSVFEPETRRLLSRVEPIARHYEVKNSPQFSKPAG